MFHGFTPAVPQARGSPRGIRMPDFAEAGLFGLFLSKTFKAFPVSAHIRENASLNG